MKNVLFVAGLFLQVHSKLVECTPDLTPLPGHSEENGGWEFCTKMAFGH
jgi:hypothetical protein